MAFKSRIMNGGEYPRLVCIETTNYCNATCSFCPNNTLSSIKAHMTDELFDKILEDCREFPLEVIEPFMQGEPFSDPKIISRMEKIRSRLPKAKLQLYSNGFAMTPGKIDQLIDLGIDHLYISINTLDPVKYKDMMGLNLNKTLDNMRYLTDPVRKNKVARKITFRMTRLAKTTLEDQDKFLAYCKDIGVTPFIVGLFNYKGYIASDLPIPDFPCEHITRLDILSSGKVTLCCQDQDAVYSWGNVNTHSVLEVYRGKIASRYRELQRSGKRMEIEPCNICNMFWASLDNMPILTAINYAIKAGIYYLRHHPTGRRVTKAANTGATAPVAQ